MATASQPTVVDTPAQPLLPRNASNESSISGRTVTRCNCISEKRLATIALVVGVVFLVLGVLGLAGYYASPNGGALSTLLQKINDGLTVVAFQMGTEPLVLACVGTGIGLGLTIAGGVTLYKHSEKQPDLNRIQLEPIQTTPSVEQAAT